MPPLSTKCVRGKGSSGAQAPRSASQVNGCTKKQNVDESLRLLDVMRATRIGCARRLKQAFQLVEGRRGCVCACCSKYRHKELFPDCSAEFEMKGSEVQ